MREVAQMVETLGAEAWVDREQHQIVRRTLQEDLDEALAGQAALRAQIDRMPLTDSQRLVITRHQEMTERVEAARTLIAQAWAK